MCDGEGGVRERYRTLYRSLAERKPQHPPFSEEKAAAMRARRRKMPPPFAKENAAVAVREGKGDSFTAAFRAFEDAVLIWFNRNEDPN